MPIETECRGEKWNEERGAWITLADGQDWLMCLPSVRLYPRYEDGVATAVASRADLGPEYDAKLALADTPDGTAVLAIMDAGVYLLRRYYNLTLEEAADLVAWSGHDDDDLFRQMVAIVRGRAAPPKLSPVGSD